MSFSIILRSRAITEDITASRDLRSVSACGDQLQWLRGAGEVGK